MTAYKPDSVTPIMSWKTGQNSNKLWWEACRKSKMLIEIIQLEGQLYQVLGTFLQTSEFEKRKN